MRDYHKDKKGYFDMQYDNCKSSILPFVSPHIPTDNIRVLEIGCGEGGVLKAFIEKDCPCVGIELYQYRVDLAKEFLKEEIAEEKIHFYTQNIYDVAAEDIGEKFDLIILKDVIEHIHDQDRFMKEVNRFLKKDGHIFYGFPAWKMPFGGHQQIAVGKISHVPYIHLLPRFLYKGLLKLSGQTKERIDELMEIIDTRLSTQKFEKLCTQNGFSIKNRTKYLIAPIYEYKFGYKTRVLPTIIAKIPWFNDFFTFQSYYLVKKEG